MTTYINFTPVAQANAQPFTFQATLDGNIYNFSVTWSLFGQRWYINCFAQDGTWIFTLPFVGSPTATTNNTINSATWLLGTATITLINPLPYPVGSTIQLWFSGMSPDAWNGTFQCIVTSPTTVTFQLADNPGVATALGVARQLISITGGYFNSTLVYRVDDGIIEVNP